VTTGGKTLLHNENGVTVWPWDVVASERVELECTLARVPE
jgi:hypothetical protein